MTTHHEIGRHDRLRCGDHVHARRFDDELVILDLNAGEYYGLDAIGARIWDELSVGKTPEEIALSLPTLYQVEYEEAMTDCLALANQLFARGLLRLQS